MKKLLPLLLIFLCNTGNIFAQDISIGAGINYGGPLPTQTIDSTDGKPLIGITAGVSYSIPLSEHFSFLPGLYYSYRGLDYSQSYTRDTLFTVVINGTSGQVPSYYTAYIDGSMRLHYLEIPLLIGYSFWKVQMTFGPYFSVLMSAKDSGDVRVVIGSGALVDDYNEVYNNKSALRKWDHGFMLGSRAPIYKNLGIEITVSRSFFSLYLPEKIPDSGQDGVKMYNTYLYFGLVYTL